MTPLDLAVVAGLVLGYGALARPLERALVTAPMLFLTAGLLLGPAGTGLVELDVADGIVRGLAELALVLLLFTDATRMDLRVLRREYALPARLLAVGLPLTVACGTAVALLLLPGLGLWEAAVLAAVLAPTDAALGEAVVSDERVPLRVRQALNVESGLNDGLVLPVLTVLVALAGGSLPGTDGGGAGVAAAQLGIGLLVGLAAGYLGGRTVDAASRRGWMPGSLQQLATLAVGLGAFGLAAGLGGSGFVAAFAAGLAFGAVAREHCGAVHRFAVEEGHLLALLTFLVVGGALAGPALDALGWRAGLYAVLSLTVVRAVPVAVALTASGLHTDTRAYLAWFGPRGLASIVFGLLLIEGSGLAAAHPILQVVVVTVLVSTVAHGITSRPAAARYAIRVAARRQRHGEAPEHAPATAMPLRR